LFYTSFRVFQHKETGILFVRQFGEFSVPTHVEHVVTLVLGLSEFPLDSQTLKVSKRNMTAPLSHVAIVPQTIQTIYKTSGASVKNGASVGVIEFEAQYFAPTDLAAFSSAFNVPTIPVTPSHTIGQNFPSQPQLEATLDIQYALGVALNAVGWFWIEGNNVWLYGFATHMFTTSNVPQVNSISYGWNEEAQCQAGIGSQECQQLGVNSKQYVALVNTEFQKIGLRGVSLICASGDSGANGRTDPYCQENHLNPPYPAASPYITSVGATQITDASGRANLPNPPPGCNGQNCASGGTETAVSFAQANFASGGGFSFVASQPAYQSKAVAQYLATPGINLPPASYWNAAGRGFPDVSAFGSNVLISSSGQIFGVGGTSCSSPIWAGVVTLLNDVCLGKGKPPLGFLNPLLYQIWAARPSAFTDITVGDNICTEGGCSSSCYGFTCAVGWDPVTGLGTPVFTELLAYINTVTCA
jgi:tripeptidyl-peptidase-1